jgi:hypothetical protein
MFQPRQVLNVLQVSSFLDVIAAGQTLALLTATRGTARLRACCVRAELGDVVRVWLAVPPTNKAGRWDDGCE